MTSMESKLVAEHREYLADLAVKAVLQVTEKEPSKYKADIDDKVEKKPGKSVRDTKLIDGIVLDKGVVHSGMPKRVENAKTALLDTALEIQKTEFDARINIESPEQIDAFLKRARFGCLRIYQHHSVFFMHVRACAWTLPSDGFSIFTYPDDFSSLATALRTTVLVTDFKFHFPTLSLKNGQSDFQLVKKGG